MIYLDNAATTLIKPTTVKDACNMWLDGYCANPGRGGHRLSVRAGEKVYECRQLIADLFKIPKAENVIFTLNTTMALNIAIKGFLKKGMHVVITGMEHNSVYRPVIDSGCDYTVTIPDSNGLVTLESIKNATNPSTALIVVTHASNVVGTVNPIREIGEFARNHNIAFLVDAAQSAGVLDIDVTRDNIDMLAFPGHKMLMGPMGTGGLYIAPHIELNPILSGGTGSVSESPFQPDFLPDRFESGTLNLVGIAGLAEGVRYVIKNTTESIYNYEKQLTSILWDNLSDMNGIKLFGNTNRVGIVSFASDNIDSVTFCNRLDALGIAARGGMHCAPLAHKSLGTVNGLVRLSVSCFNTVTHIHRAIDEIYKISRQN